ncbi:MFS transporter [Cryobacterium sp. Hh7]|uniref:CynX/NimT family MFS transporter n=1 Tax=Cryobacterium sp. Hh7 TaxID=1259159 RepID=UPI00141B64F5|nr:MFS transporter [Cryobacterium sp. Hh7]
MTRTDRRLSWKLWTAIGTVLIALNFRPAVVAVSPLLDQIGPGAGLSTSAAGLLLTLPVLCFGLLGPTAPALARRFGIERTLGGVLLAVLVGSALRLIPTVPALFAGTIMIGAGIAVGNILLPVLIKRDFPHSIGLMSGLYTLSITGGAALAAGITVPIARAAGLSWNAALGGWGLLALVGLLVLIPGMRRAHPRVARAEPGTILPVRIRLMQDRMAWLVTVFFGLQALNFYSMTAWLPTMLIARGFDATAAGLLLSLNSLASIIPAMLTPVLVARVNRQSFVAVALGAIYVVALLGLILAPTAAPLWVCLLGVAQGATLGLALTLILVRSPDTHHAAQLSGMAQSWGYTIAAVGPLLLGALFEVTQDWVVPLVFLALLILPQTATGYRAGRPSMVGA